LELLASSGVLSAGSSEEREWIAFLEPGNDMATLIGTLDGAA
jgi:hypothetical protein